MAPLTERSAPVVAKGLPQFSNSTRSKHGSRHWQVECDTTSKRPRRHQRTAHLDRLHAHLGLVREENKDLPQSTAAQVSPKNKLPYVFDAKQEPLHFLELSYGDPKW